MVAQKPAAEVLVPRRNAVLGYHERHPEPGEALKDGLQTCGVDLPARIAERHPLGVMVRHALLAPQGGGAVGGWLLGATIGPGTIVVIVLLGPLIDITSRLLRLEIHQGDRVRS